MMAIKLYKRIKRVNHNNIPKRVKLRVCTRNVRALN